ncbi:MAG TPA: flagellar hook capping FlgD N-terminal domain-containing protein [Acidobacteriaceae bacterium]
MQITTNPIAASPFAAVQPADSGATTQSSSGDSSTDSATITANDFLQLLVTEMKNQDPTANTDPNEYINQLVQVNSLQQLISINQDLSWVSQASGGSGSGGSGSGGSNGSVGGIPTPNPTAPVASAEGNLSAIDAGPKASRIATAMGAAAQTLAPGSSGSPIESAINTLRSRAQSARTNLSNPTH